MKRSLLIFFIVLGSMSACMMGPNYQKPETNLPSAYKYGGTVTDSVLNLSWWEIFNDEVLDELIDSAIANNQNALIAAARIEEARSIIGFTKADMYPKIDGKVNYNFTNQLVQGLGETNDDPLHLFNANLPLSWEIDFWGKFRRANEAARAEMVASEFGYRAIMMALITEVTINYFTFLDFKQRIFIAEQTLESRRESLRIIQEKFNEGYIPEIDLNQAQIQEAIAQAAIPAFKRSARLTENALNVLLGRFPETIETTGIYAQEIPDFIPVGFPSQLIARRPDVLEAEYFLVAQNARIGIAEAQRFPAIGINGLIGVSGTGTSFTTGNFVWGAGASLAAPLINFGKNKRRVEIERFRTEQSRYNYQQAVITAVSEVENALIEIDTYKEELAATQKRMAAAQNAASLSLDRYNGGVTSYLEVLESDRSKFDAELVASQTYREFLNAYIKLYKALGGGWINKEEETNSQNQTTE